MHQGSSHKIGDFIYQESDFLGQGSYGKVYKGKNQGTGDIVAIKILDMSLFTDQFMLESLKTEISVMKELKDQHLVRLYDCIGDAKQTIMILELCDGDLRKLLEKNHGMLDEQLTVTVLSQLMQGFKEMVSHNYIHRDIKPENALSKNDVYKVADFGFATKADILGKQTLKECVGTPLYMAPQLLAQKQYTAKSDIWSIGILVYELLYGKQPWPARDCESYLRNIKSMPLRFPVEKTISEDMKDFIRKCLEVSEETRIGWDKVFDHGILKKTTAQKQFIQDNVDVKSKDILAEIQKLVQAQNLNLIQIFQNTGQGHKGTLNITEFNLLLNQLDPRVTHYESDHLFSKMDKNGDGTLQFDEFKAVFCENDYSDLNDRAGQIITELREIIKANNLNLEDIFRNFDKDRTGTLDNSEFAKLIRVIAPALKDQEINKIFIAFDKNQDASISFDEFKRELSFATKQDSKFNPKNEKAEKIIKELKRIVTENNVKIEAIFKNFDKNQDAQLDFEEFSKICDVMDKGLTKDEKQSIFQIVDKNFDGSIKIDEFVKLFA